MPDCEVIAQRTLLQKVKFFALAGGGFFGDGYLNTTIGLVIPMLGYLYFVDGVVPALQGDTIKGAFNIGMILGQIGFGVLSDTFGRHVVYGKELIFTVTGTILVVLMPWNRFSTNDVVAWLSIFRVVTGIGTGADYPVTSALSNEQASAKRRSRQTLGIFSFNSLGSLSAGIVLVILLAGFKTRIEHDNHAFEYVWRLLLGLGTVPLFFTIYARFRIQETKAYTKFVRNQNEGAQTKRSLATQWRDFAEYFRKPRHTVTLFATCASWFLYDIASYGIGLNQSIILKDIGFAAKGTPYETVWKIAVGNLIVSLAGNIPGVYIGIFLPELFGRRRLQVTTCALAGGFFAVWAGVNTFAASGGLITLYTLSSFALACGPNLTTFLIPSESFPTRVRSTAHGVSAASGKVGAVLTAFTFASFTDAAGLSGVLGFLSGILFLVCAVTFLVPEPKGKTITQIEGEEVDRAPAL